MAIRKRISKKTGKVSWQIDYFDPNGKRVRQSFKKKKDAEAELGKRVSLIRENRYLDVKKRCKTTFGQLVEKYKETFGDQKSFLTCKWFFIENFIQYFKENTLLSNIRFVDVEGYQNHLKKKLTPSKKPRTAAAINREMSCLRHMFKKAVEWDMTDKSPFTAGQSLTLKEDNQRLRYLSEDEISLLLDACSTKVIEFPGGISRVKQMTRKDINYLREIVECAINTGMRKGEILSLKWEQIRNGFIYLLRKTKTCNPRQIPINEDLDALFKRIRQRQGLKYAYVFIFQGKRLDGLNNGFKAALKRAGIEDFRFHDLRHTFASHFVMRGGDLKALQEILGHTTLTMTMKYTHLSPGHKMQAVSLLNGLTTGKKADCHASVTFSGNEKPATL